MSVRDARLVASGEVIDAEVCIVGAGPAGLSAAMALTAQGIRVCLLESGGFEPDAATQLLARTEVVENEDLYPEGYYSRTRQYGGTANQWCVLIDGKISVRYTPLDPIDFEKRDWVPHSGWPISRADLEPYYERAQVACEAGVYDYRPERWSADRCRPFALPSGRVETKMFTFGPRDLFVVDHRRQIEASDRTTLMVHANVVELLTDASGTVVNAARVACLGGGRFDVRARMFVLAQGALEVPRLLLASRAVHGQGLGNAHDQVGRYLQDHQLVTCGSLAPRDPGLYRSAGFYDLRRVSGTSVIGKLGLSPETLRRERLLNAASGLFPRKRLTWQRLSQRLYGRGTTVRSPAYHASRQLLNDLRARRFPRDLPGRLRRIIAGLDDIAYVKTRSDPLFKPSFDIDHGGWHDLPEAAGRFDFFDVVQLVEQAPDPQNRVTLGESHDATGMRRAKIAWKWNALDVDSIFRTQAILRHELALAGIGDLTLERRGDFPLQIQSSAHHPAGTTRMSIDPRQGVVDADCQVHGTHNLFVASSAVFPTSGYANPTLTIVAIALRVADRVTAALASAPAPGLAHA